MMAHQIDIDQVKGIIRLVHWESIHKEALLVSHQELLEKIKGMEAPKILVDLREAILKVEDWEKREFAEWHKQYVTKKAKIAALIQINDPNYNDFQHLETLFVNRGINLRMFDNEYAAESWLAG